MLPFAGDRPKELTYRHGERPLHAVLLKHAAEQPGKTAIVWYGAEISFGQLADWIHRFAVVLQGLGVTRGDRVALFLHNCPQYYIAHYAAQLIGAIVSPVSPAYKAMELSYQISDLEAKVLITAESLYPVVQEAGDAVSLDHVVLTHYGALLPGDAAWTVPSELLTPHVDTKSVEMSRGDGGSQSVIDMFTAIDEVPPGTQVEPEAVSLDDTCLLVYTSGTTGRPKGAMLSYRNALFKTAASGLANGVTADDRVLSVMPLSHIAGMLMGLNVPIYTGCTVILMYRFDPKAILEALSHSRATWWYSTTPMNLALMATAKASVKAQQATQGVPAAQAPQTPQTSQAGTELPMEVESTGNAAQTPQTSSSQTAIPSSGSASPSASAFATAAQAGYDLSHLRVNLCTSFGIQLTKEIADEWAVFTGGCAVHEAAYGLSETHTADTFMPIEAVKWGTQGIPVYQTEIRIVDPDTHHDVPRGEQGEIFVRGPGVFQGYWRKPEATQRTLEDGYVKTGDVGRLDEDGYLTFLGRIKEMIKVSGFSVFPEDVEALLMAHPSVAQVAVIGVPDEQRGEVVKAFIVRKPSTNGTKLGGAPSGDASNGDPAQSDSISEQDIIEWARSHMASYKVPRFVEFIDALPTSSTGKVLRRLLAEH